MSKSQLYNKLQEQYDLNRLMRLEARKEKFLGSKKRDREPKDKYSSTCSSTDVDKTNLPPKKKVKLNTIDPIMFTPIDKKNTFLYVRPNGSCVRFNIAFLVDYLLISGDFNDPETRIPFSDENLKEIDEIAKKASLNKASVYAAKNNVNAYTDSRFRRDALLGLERCAGEVITEMLDVCENYDPDEAQMQLVMIEFPTFLDYFRQIKEVDTAYASKCISHWRLFMQGPPNKPNEDEIGLINVVCQFLKSCDNGNVTLERY